LKKHDCEVSKLTGGKGMSGGEVIIPEGEERRGWFKLMIPAIVEVFGEIVIGQKMDLLPFIYAKLDPDQVAFNIDLSQPMYALDKVALVQIDRARKPDPSKPLPVNLVGLAVISSEQEGRCYIPTGLVSCIIPVKSDHPLVGTLIMATTESQLVMPTLQESAKILDMSGQPVDNDKPD